MNINFMCLGNEITPEMDQAQKAILSEFREVFGGRYTFQNSGSEREFISQLSDSVDRDDILVLTTAPELFVAFKSFVSSAFSLKTRTSRNLQKLIRESHPELDAATVNGHAILPVEADVIMSQDGLRSGYGVRAEEQILLVLPLDAERIQYLLDDGVFPYLRDNLDFSQFITAQLDASANVENVPVSAAVSSEAAAVSAETMSNRRTSDVFNDAYIRSVISKMKRRNLTVSVADTKTVDFLRAAGETVGTFDGTIFFSDFSLEKGDMESDEYAVQLAKGAYDHDDKSLGATLTKVYARTTDDTLDMEDENLEYYIYACVSDGKTANEARITADDGETPPQLIYKGIEVLFRMISQWADTGVAEPQKAEEVLVDDGFVPEDEDEAPEVTVSRMKNRKVRTAIGALIAAAFAGGAAISLFASNVYGLL